MQLIVMFNDEPLPINIDPSVNMKALQMAIEQISGVPVAEQTLLYNGEKLTFAGSLSSFQIVENDLIELIRSSAPSSRATMHLHELPASISPEELIKVCNQYPNLKTQLSNADPTMFALLVAEDVPSMRALVMKRMMMNHKVVYEQKQQEAAIWANPDDEENQQIIAEKIRMENVQANLMVAMEELPEGFGRVIMLYVDVEINGHPVKAFVDSGAQSTIMSVMCAERCGLMRLLDKRYAGEARGVGTAKILGRVHIVQMKFGNSFFPVSITILDQNDVDFLFGLDMLKRHRCEISLRDNELRIDGGSGLERVPFLSEHNLPSKETTAGENAEFEKLEVETSGGAGGGGSCASEVGLEKVQQLQSLGFTEQQARAALTQSGGDADMAATLLLSSL